MAPVMSVSISSGPATTESSPAVGTANPARILENIRQIEESLDETLLREVQDILKPVHNMTWPSGRPENN